MSLSLTTKKDLLDLVYAIDVLSDSEISSLQKEIERILSSDFLTMEIRSKNLQDLIDIFVKLEKNTLLGIEYYLKKIKDLINDEIIKRFTEQLNI